MAAFLEGRLRWTAIPEVLSDALSRHDGTALNDVEDVIDVDRRAREVATTLLTAHA